MRKIASLLVGALAVTAAQAQVWLEIPDAPEGPSPGQMTGPPGVGLTTIIGDLVPGTPDMADMYCIHVVDTTFGATVSFFSGGDSQLFLFDLAQGGVTHNDDFFGLLSAIGTDHPDFVAIPPGEYGLAISGYDHDPVNGAGAEMWADVPFGDETGPDGAGGALAGWAGAGAQGHYEITLHGAEMCPEPGSLALLALGGLALIRRR